MRALYVAACVACLALAVAVMVNVAFFTEPSPAAPPDTGTTTTVPAVAPVSSEGAAALSGDAGGVAGREHDNGPHPRPTVPLGHPHPS